MATYEDLAGKVALVTGSRGLGAATCRVLAANAARVAVNGRDAAAVDDVVRELRDMGTEATPAVADCTDAGALAHARDDIDGELGPVDVLIVFAGSGRQPQPVLEIDEGERRADVDGNLTVTVLTVKTFLPAMIDRRSGVVVTIGRGPTPRWRPNRLRRRKGWHRQLLAAGRQGGRRGRRRRGCRSHPCRQRDHGGAETSRWSASLPIKKPLCRRCPPPNSLPVPRRSSQGATFSASRFVPTIVGRARPGSSGA
jgi:NAD(P)-dependent dehydrogenase (short-subunit alcohol dehydrogenase family)